MGNVTCGPTERLASSVIHSRTILDRDHSAHKVNSNNNNVKSNFSKPDMNSSKPDVHKTEPEIDSNIPEVTKENQKYSKLESNTTDSNSKPCETVNGDDNDQYNDDQNKDVTTSDTDDFDDELVEPDILKSCNHRDPMICRRLFCNYYGGTCVKSRYCPWAKLEQTYDRRNLICTKTIGNYRFLNSFLRQILGKVACGISQLKQNIVR